MEIPQDGLVSDGTLRVLNMTMAGMSAAERLIAFLRLALSQESFAIPATLLLAVLAGCNDDNLRVLDEPEPWEISCFDALGETTTDWGTVEGAYTALQVRERIVAELTGLTDEQLDTVQCVARDVIHREELEGRSNESGTGPLHDLPSSSSYPGVSAVHSFGREEDQSFGAPWNAGGISLGDFDAATSSVSPLMLHLQYDINGQVALASVNLAGWQDKDGDGVPDSPRDGNGNAVLGIPSMLDDGTVQGANAYTAEGYDPNTDGTISDVNRAIFGNLEMPPWGNASPCFALEDPRTTGEAECLNPPVEEE